MTESLKEKIKKEMMVDHKNALEKNLELAKKLINITSEGKVDVLVKHGDKFDASDKISTYLIGKMYAKEADLTETEFVSNKEIMDELGMPEGTVKSTLKGLRDTGKAISKDGSNSIKSNMIEKVLLNIREKIGE